MRYICLIELAEIISSLLLLAAGTGKPVALGLSIVILGNVSHTQGVATIGVLECL
jgi:hypothetical protein